MSYHGIVLKFGIGLALANGVEAAMSHEKAIQNTPSETDAVRKKARRRQAGFTLTEMIIVVYVLGLVSAIVSSTFIDKFDKARLARCMVEMRGIQSAVALYSQDGVYIPDPKEFWAMAFPGGKRPGPYFYLIDGDPNKGHGNDLDGIDEENPGKSWLNLERLDIKFVILCQHDHKDLASYVYVSDDSRPYLAQPGNDPGYDDFIKWEFGGPGNEK
jgi:prepilin-type N-terminal cleavage/methylation domain-containing protein